MLKNGNKFMQPPEVDYTQVINVWIDDKQREHIIKRLMIEDKNMNVAKIKTNPVYHEAIKAVIMEQDKLLEKYDKSYLWSRKLTPKKFRTIAIPLAFYALIVVPYIAYKIVPRRILESHIKYDYDGEFLNAYYNIDFKNKDLYSEGMIKSYFDVKKRKEHIEEEKVKALAYSEKFVENISQGYMSDFYKRRRAFGFNDED